MDHNPFEYKEPLTESGRGVLVERAGPLRQAMQFLQRSGFLTVCAPPRSGVTTFLHSLRKAFPRSVYIDLANLGFSDDPPRQAANNLAAGIMRCSSFQISDPNSVADVLAGFTKHTAGLESPGEPLTVMVDGFDTWDDSDARKLVLALRAAYTEARTLDERRGGFSVITGSAVDLRDLTASGRTSPLNIAQHIFLPDFRANDLLEMMMNGFVSAIPSEHINGIVERVAYWTGGHPALSQMLGHLVFEASGKVDLRVAESCDAVLPAVRDEVRQLLTGSISLLSQRSDLRRTVIEIYSGADVICDRIHRPIRDLIHLGLICADERGKARPRNRLFEEILASALRIPDGGPSPQTQTIERESTQDAMAQTQAVDDAFKWPSPPSSTSLHREASGSVRQQNESPILQPGALIGGCQIVRKIGRGGMAEVYLARHVGLETDVAIKIMRPNAQDPRMAQRFLREARAAAQLNHENIVQIRNVGREGGIQFIEMEYLSGGSLAELLRRAPFREFSRAAKMMKDAAAGLQAAHAKGIIHRDVKPDNLMITHDGRVKVVDFGLAAIMSSEGLRLTQQGVIVGTPHYMAPEQWEGKPVDERSDIYSLGATFYNLLAGRPPFEGKTPMEVIGNFLADSAPHPKQYNSEIPDALGHAVMKMIEKRASHRYGSIRELLSDPEGLGAF